MLKPKILSSLLHAASALGGLLGIGWLMREGLGGTALAGLLFFLTVFLVLAARQYPRAAGDALDWLFCWMECRSRAVARSWQSYRISYQAEVAEPMPVLRDRVRVAVERLEEIVAEDAG